MAGKRTITSIFMVPTLKIPKDQLANNGFVNAFVADIDKDNHFQDCIYLLFKPTNIEKFREFLEEEYKRTEIIEDYDYPNGYVVVVYKLNSQFMEDYKLIRLGKYSKTSDEFKKVFPDKINIVKNGWNKEETSLQFRIFNKTKDLVEYWEEKMGIKFEPDQEVWSGYDENAELLHITELL